MDVPERGYGAALYHGSLTARGRFIVMGDAADGYDFGEIGPMLERLRAGADLVMGNRFRGGVRARAMPWKNHYIGNAVLTGIGRVLFRVSASGFRPSG